MIASARRIRPVGAPGHRADALEFHNITTGAPGAFAPNVLARVTITRDASDLFTGYVNGVQQIQFTDGGTLATFSTGTQIARFFQDDLVFGGEASAGRVNYIRTFDTALSAAQVAALGVPSAVPEPQTYAMMLVGLLLTAGVARARKR